MEDVGCWVGPDATSLVWLVVVFVVILVVIILSVFICLSVVILVSVFVSALLDGISVFVATSLGLVTGLLLSAFPVGDVEREEEGEE
jgi:hypothetical protein